MAQQDRYGLSATFEFDDGDSLAKIQKSINQLNQLQQQIDQFRQQQSRTVSVVGSVAQQVGRANQQAANTINRFNRPNQQLKNQLQSIAKEFRAIKAEARNIDFGDLHDTRAFESGRQSIARYVSELKALESQIAGVSAEERILTANLKRQQKVMEDRVSVAANQRTAAIAQQRMGVAGGVATAGAAALLPLVSVGKEAINTVASFDDQIAQARAVSGASIEESNRIRERAKQLGAETKFSASQAASAFVLLGQAGYSADQQLKAIDGTLMLAAAGGIDLATATDIAVSTMGGFNAKAEEAIHYSNVLAQTANAANLGVADLGETMKYVAPAAKAYGATVEQAAAMAGVLSNAGIKGTQAGTSLRAMFLRLSAPTKAASGQLRQYGIDVSDSSGHLRQLPELLGEMNTALKDVDDAKKMEFVKKVFGTEASSAVLNLMANLKDVRDLTKQNIVSSVAFEGLGVAAYQAGVMEDNLAGAFRSFLSALEGVTIEVGDFLKVAVRPLVDNMTLLMRGFLNLPKPIKNLAIGVGVLLTGLSALAAVGGAIAVAFFWLQSAVATAAIGLTTMASAGLPLTGFFATVMNAFAGQGLVAGFTALGSAMGGVATAMLSIAGPMTAWLLLFGFVQAFFVRLNLLGTAFSYVGSVVGLVTGLIQGFIVGASKAFLPIIGDIKALANSLFPAAKGTTYLGTALHMAADAFRNLFAVGSKVGGVLGSIFGTLLALPLRIVIGIMRVTAKIINLAGYLYAVLRGIGKLIVKVFLSIGSAIVSAVTAPVYFVISAFQRAVERIRSAWQGFVDWFSAMPLVKFAGGIAQGLINALNHNPTVKIPLAWESARSQITDTMGALLSPAQSVGDQLSSSLDWTGDSLSKSLSQAENWMGAFGKAADHAGGLIAESIGSVPFVDDIASNGSAALQHITATVDSLSSSVSSALSPVTAKISTAFDGAGKAVQGTTSVIGGLSSAFTSVAGSVSPVMRGLNMMFDGLESAGDGDFAKMDRGWSLISKSVLKSSVSVKAAAKQIREGMAVTFGGLNEIGGVVYESVGGALSFLNQAFESNFLGIHDTVSGSVAWLRSTFGFLSSSFDVLLSPIAGAVDKIKGAWSGFKGWFGDLTASLPGMGQEAGQGLIDALNHNPTVKIPIAWEEARDRIQGSIAGLVPQAESVAGDLVGAFSDRAGQLTATLQNSFSGSVVSPSITQPSTTSSPGAATVIVDPSPAVKAFHEIEIAGTKSGDQVQKSFAGWVGGGLLNVLWSAVRVVGSGLFNLLLSVVHVVNGITTAADHAAGALGRMLLGAIAGIVTALSPALFVVGALILAFRKMPKAIGLVSTALSPVFDVFKGLKNAAQGFIDTVLGGFDGVNLAVKSVSNAVRGVIQIVEGVPSAIDGNFAQIKSGASQIVDSFGGLRTSISTTARFIAQTVEKISTAIGSGFTQVKNDASRIVDSFEYARIAILVSGKNIADGIKKSFDGLKTAVQGLDRVFQPVKALFSQAFEGVSVDVLGVRTVLEGMGVVGKSVVGAIVELLDGLKFAFRSVSNMVDGVIRVIKGIPAAITGDMSKVDQGINLIVASFKYAFHAIGLSASRLIQELLKSFDGLKIIGQGLGQAMAQIKTAISDGIAFAGKLPDRVQSIVDQVVSLWRGATQKISAITPVIDWSVFERAREIVATVVDQVGSLWRGVVSLVNGTPLSVDASKLESLKSLTRNISESVRRLPAQVKSVMDSIKQSVVSTTEGIAAPFIAAVDKIAGLWQGLTDRIAAPLSGLVEKAKKFGLDLIRNLSENSPSPTFQIRQKWLATTEAIAGQLTRLAAHAKTAGSQIATGLGDKAAGKLSKLSGGFTQAGVLLSNFAPGLAAPLFVVNDVLDTIEMSRESLPGLKKGFATLKGKAAGLTGVLPSVATSLMGVGTSAMAAIAPMLPFVGIAAAIGGATFLLYKAFQSNFLGIRDVVSGVVNWLRSTFSFLSASFAVLLSPITGAVDKIKGAWSGFRSWFGDLTASLPGMGQEAGQGLIDALNHNPTVKIPIAWEEARDRIQDSITGLVPQAESVAGDLVGAFSDRAGQLAATLQQSFGGGIDSPTISPATPGAPVQLSVDPQPAVGALQKLKTTATQTGEQLRQSLSNVVNTQPVDQLRSAMQSVKTAAEKAGDSMKGLLLSAIATGLAALAGLSPVVLVVGGLALVAGAVATNFLGARTILKGLGQVATGSIEMAIAVFDGLAATVKMVIGVISGIAQAIGGIPVAIRGDFSQVQSGLDQVGSSFRAGFMTIGAAGDRMAAGLRTVFGGLSTIGQGFGEAIGQIKAVIGGTINFAATLPERLGAIADQLVAAWHVGVQQIGNIIPSVDWSRFDGLPAWLGGISDRLISAWRTVSTTIAGVLLSPDLSLIERAQSVMTAASDAIGSAWRSVVVLVGELPLMVDGSGLERLKGLAQSVADGIGSIWRGLTGVIGSLPLVPDGSGFERARGLVSGASESIQSVWRSAVGFVAGLPLTATWDALRELPGRLGAIADSLKTAWQGAIAFINNLIPQVDLSHLLALPDRVGSVMVGIKQSVVSTAEGLAAPFVAAIDKIVGLWQGLTDKITAPLSELVEKAKGFGLGLIRNLSENSPGPTFQIRQKWMATTEAIAGQLTGLTAHAKTAGAQIANGLGEKAASKLSKLSGGFTQAGVLLSNFAPGLAAPLFVVNDVLDTIGMAQENLPALKDGFSKLTGVTAQLPQRLGAIGSGLLSIAGTGLSTLSAAITPALASIGTAATAAWSSLIAPLLPFVAIAAGVVLAIVLIRKAFKSNFLGLRDIVDRVMGAIASAGMWVAAPFQMIGKTIAGAIDKLSAGWDRVKSLVGGVLGFLPRAAKETGGQLVDALNHNPTVKIPLAWEAAGGQISQTMTGLVDRATVVASDLTDRLTLAPQITPEVISPTNATTPLATPGAIAVPVEVTGTRQLDQVKATIQTVSQSAGQFARNTMAAIGSLPQWGQKAQDAIASVAGQFGWATAGAIGFGVTALAGLSPVVLVAGALALAAGAVMSNFLGARTIVKGLGQVASGSIEIAIAVFDGLAATVRMVVGTIKGIVQAIGGIPTALRGDFSQVQAGLDQVGASFKSGFAAIGAAGDRLIGGLRTVFDGLSTIGRGFLEAVDQISAAVRGLPGLAGETFTSIGARVDGLRQSLSNAADAIVAPFVGAIEKIGALWSGLTDRVSGFFGKLTGKAQSTGQQLVSALAENSPGPTFQIRQKWAATTEAIGGHLSELVAKGKKTGGQLAASLGDKVAGKLGKISGGFTQIGVLLSNVSPALAAPFFLMNDILDSAGMVAENLPALQKGLSKVGVIAGKLPGVLGGLGATLGSLGSSLLTLAGPVVAAISSSLVPIFGAVAMAAGTAWSAVIAPALPFIGIAAAIVGAVWLIKKAFDTNFLGIRDLITNVFKAISAVGAWLLTPFRAIGNAVQGAIALIVGGWQKIEGVVSGVLGFLPGLAMKAGNGLVNALNHNPTVRIPIAWDEARTQVTGSIQSMVPVAESAGTQMSAALSSQPVIQPIVATPTGSGEAALPTATQTVQQQVAAPASGASFLAPITAGIAGVTAQFDQMRSAATGAIGSAIDGVGKLSGGFVQLAVAALPSLLPIGLALAGIALAAAAIATNFLGVRTIVGAVFDAIRGAIEGVRQVFSGMVQIVEGVINVFRGLGAALTGDWSLVQVGLTQIRSGFQYVFGGLGAIVQSGVGLAKGVLTGFGQAVKQVWSVVKQFLGPVGDLIEGIFDRIGATIRDAMSRIELLTSKLAGVGQAIANSPFGKLFGGGKNAAAAMPEPEAKQGGWWTKLGGDKTDEPSAAVKTADEIATDRINSAQTALSSLGSIASVIAPQLAGPIGAVSSLFDGFIGLAGVLPQISSAMSFFGFTASAANTAQSVTAGAAAGATATQTGVTVTGTAAMATGFTGLAAAAGTAWAAITGPLLPIIAGIAIIGAVIWAVSKNVWGLGDAFRAAWRVTIEPFWRAFYEAGASIRAAFISLGQAISEIFGIRAVGPLNLFGKLAAGIFTVLLLPIRILAIAVGGLIKLIGGVIAAAIYGIATLARIVFWPVSMVLRGVEAIRSAVWAVVNGIANLLLRPFDAIGVIIRFVGSAIGAVIGGVAAMGRIIWSVIQPIAGWMVSLLGGIFAGPLQILKSGISAVMSMFTGMASGVQSAFAMVTGAIGSAFSMIWTLIPAPLRWILEQASKGIGWLMSAVTGGGQPQGTLEPQRFAVGGLVKGPGGPTGDRVPALLSAGEFVVNAAATASNLPILAALNAGRALAQDGAPEVMPMPVPMPPVRSVGSMASGASLGNAGGREVTINLNFGGITLQGSPTEAAEQFKAEILYDEQFQRAVRDALRDLVEFSK